ncbi:hypothetical protein [Brucella pseudintermedia]|uniref:hypothetical protein n=1 Tax=Brucella pseudintermedia TaxID=370111 RepID=UPI0030F41A68
MRRRAVDDLADIGERFLEFHGSTDGAADAFTNADIACTNGDKIASQRPDGKAAARPHDRGRGSAGATVEAVERSSNTASGTSDLIDKRNNKLGTQDSHYFLFAFIRSTASSRHSKTSCGVISMNVDIGV